jgi:hypothetical protein
MWLRVLTGREAGRALEIAGRVVVGRERDCDLVLRDDGVAPRHAIVTRSQGRVEIEDLGSPGGTFVAGRRIRGTVRLEGTEQLCFGYTFAALASDAPGGRWRRSSWLLAAAGAVGLAIVGATAVLLVPRADDAVQSGPALVAATTQAGTTAPEASAVTPAAEPVPSAETSPSPEPGPRRVLFEERFADPGSGWEVFEDSYTSARYENGRFVVRIEDPDYFATVDSGRAFADPVVRVTVGNPGRATTAGFGVLCNYRGPKRYDVLAVATDGTAAVLRRTGGKLHVVSGGGSWTASPHVPAGADRYVLRADCAGDELRLLVGGHPVVEAAAGARGGRVGFFAAGRAELWFDDVLVRRGR